MRKQSFYLDTNVISDLADPEKTDQKIPQRLALLVRSRACEIIGSADIIEELAPIARSKPVQFARSLELFWTLVGDKVLVWGDTLLAREIRKGSMLSRAEAFLDAGTVRRFQALRLDDVGTWDEIAKGVHRKGEEFTDRMHENGEKVQEVMLKTVTANDIGKIAGQYELGEKTIKNWFHDLLKSNRETLGLPADETKWPDVAQLPCMRACRSLSRRPRSTISICRPATGTTPVTSAICAITRARQWPDVW